MNERTTMTTSPEASEREAFERYFAESRKSKGVARRPTFDRMADDTYADDHTQRHWWTWQNARAALRAPKVEAPGEGDLPLSRVLHELAGAASLCWVPRPTGVFDSQAAIAHVERAIAELRAALSHPLPALAPLQVDNKPQG
jgi:hypothetical protein